MIIRRFQTVGVVIVTRKGLILNIKILSPKKAVFFLKESVEFQNVSQQRNIVYDDDEKNEETPEKTQ